MFVFRIVTVSLLLAVFIPALLGYSVMPFQMQTITSTEQSTTTFTTSSYSFSSYTSYATSVVSQQELYTGPITIVKVPTQYGCEYNNLPFTASKGNELTGSLTSDRLVSFYIMTKTYYSTWKLCDATANSDQILFTRDGVTSLSFDLTISNDDTYEFILLNYDHSNPVNINFQSAIVGSSVTQVTTETGFSPELVVQTMTSTSSGLALQTIQSAKAGGDMWFIVIVAIVLIAVAAIVVVLRRRVTRSVKDVPPSLAGSDLVKPRKSDMFCKECGGKIPRDSKFCQKCGSPMG